nr:hypothetical protein [uncultured Carboxylicivirga sp.]
MSISLSFKRATLLHAFLFFCLLFLLHVVLREMRSSFISENHIYDYYRSMFSEERVQEIIKNKDVNSWSFFVFKPIEILISTILLLTTFVTGFFLLERKVRFIKLLNAILLAQVVLYIPFFIQNVWFMLKDDFTIKEYSSFSWHSVYDVFSSESVPQYLSYALHKFSLFQLIFVVVLAFLLKNEFRIGFLRTLKSLIIIYFPALALWCSFVTFLILYFK